MRSWWWPVSLKTLVLGIDRSSVVIIRFYLLKKAKMSWMQKIILFFCVSKVLQCIHVVISDLSLIVRFYQLRFILTAALHAEVARCLINVVYLRACAFIRSWWCCTFWMTSPMMVNQHKNSIIMSYSQVWRVNQLGKLINRIPGLRPLKSRLPGSALRTHFEMLGKPCDFNKRSRSLAW